MAASLGRLVGSGHRRDAFARTAGAILGLLMLGACATGLSLEPRQYPPVARGDVVDDYHGTPVADPYRWLEQLDSPETQAFVASQNALSGPWLGALPDQQWFRQRLAALYNYERFGTPVEAGGRYFFLRNDGQQDQAALHVGESPGDLGRVLIDPASLRSDATVSLASYEPSPDGRLLAYALSDAGSDWKTWHVREVATGADLPDLLQHTKFTTVSWARDGSGFYYSAYPDGNDQLQAVVRFHRLGEPQQADREVYAVRDHPTRVPYGKVTRGRPLPGHHAVRRLPRQRHRRTRAGRQQRHVTPVFTRYDGLYEYLGSRRGVGTELLFKTNAGAPNGRIVAADLGLPATPLGR